MAFYEQFIEYKITPPRRKTPVKVTRGPLLLSKAAKKEAEVVFDLMYQVETGAGEEAPPRRAKGDEKDEEERDPRLGQSWAFAEEHELVRIDGADLAMMRKALSTFHDYALELLSFLGGEGDADEWSATFTGFCKRFFTDQERLDDAAVELWFGNHQDCIVPVFSVFKPDAETPCFWVFRDVLGK